MGVEEMTAWLALRGVDAVDMGRLLAEFAGSTETELDDMYDAMHGDAA